MSDRLNDVLAAIDAETAKCICGRTVPADGPSLDYCSDSCQYGYTAQQVGAELDDEFAYDIDQGPTDGRTINAEVNDWFERTAVRPGHRTITVPIRIDITGITEAARQLQGSISRSMADAAAASARSIEELAHAVAPESREEEQDSACNPCQGHTISTQGVGETRVMWVPDIADPNAPTVGELAAGVTLGVLDGNGILQAERPALLTPEALNRSLLELYNTYPGHMEALGAECEPPLTADEFRARALEHRQNRGTGPAERRQRLPRHHGPRRNR
jgi:hypothetical protein